MSFVGTCISLDDAGVCRTPHFSQDDAGTIDHGPTNNNEHEYGEATLLHCWHHSANAQW